MVLWVRVILMSTSATEGCDVMAECCERFRNHRRGYEWVCARDVLIVGRVRPCVLEPPA